MIVTANSHIGFNCKDLDRTQKFYEDILGCKEKFSLYYGPRRTRSAGHR